MKDITISCHESPSLLANLSQLGLIQVSGQNSQNFLQGQFTCDVREVTPTQSRLGAYCNAKGRIIAIFCLYQFQNQFYLLLPQNILQNTLSQLKKYAVFSKVELTDVSAQWQLLGCSGIQGQMQLEKECANLPQEVDTVVAYSDHLVLRVPGKLPRFEIIGSKQAIDKLHDALSQYLVSADDKDWHLLDMDAGIPRIYPETIEQFTPHMVNLPELNGVSFKKGCYVGQEIVARTHYLGKAKRRMHKAYLNAPKPPQPGDPLMNRAQQEIGTIVDCALIKDHFYHLLVIVQDEAIEWSEIYSPQRKR